eukprot:2918357-Prymnesium_polylepis.1
MKTTCLGYALRQPKNIFPQSRRYSPFRYCQSILLDTREWVANIQDINAAVLTESKSIFLEILIEKPHLTFLNGAGGVRCHRAPLRITPPSPQHIAERPKCVGRCGAASASPRAPSAVKSQRCEVEQDESMFQRGFLTAAAARPARAS